MGITDKSLMETRFFAIFVLFVNLVLWSPLASAKEDCSCPKVSCGPCQKQVQIGKSVKFCSWGDINVCKKIICENVTGYFKCLSGSVKQSKPLAQEGPQEDLVLAYEAKKQTKKNKKARTGRRPSSIRFLDKEEKDRPIDFNPPGLVLIEDESRNYAGENYSKIQVATLSKYGKGIELEHERTIFAPKKGRKLFVGDRLHNAGKKNKSTHLELPQGKLIFQMGPGSQVLLLDPESVDGRFRPFFHLISGDILVHSQFKSSGVDILAGRALTRLTKGKAFLQYQESPKGLRVNIEGRQGEAQVFPSDNLSSTGLRVPAGAMVSWYKEGAGDQGLVDPDRENPGLLTPVFQMEKSRLQALGLVPKAPKSEFPQWSSPKNGRKLASSEASSGKLCQGPLGDFETCAWTCEGAKKGAKSCQTQKKGVRCVRRVCNAAGQWGLPTGFESPYSDLCPGQGTRVGHCRP